MKPAVQFFFAVSSLIVVARAHDTWLQPEVFAATPGAALVLHMTSADGFNGPETAIKPERVERMWGRLGGAAVAVEAVGGEGGKTLRLAATLTQPGVAVLAVQLKPRLLELAPEKIEVYFREIHATAELREVWAAVPEPRRWRESTVKCAKTFVRVGAPVAGDRSWAEPLGLPLELVPENDPTALRVGERFSVRVLKGGAPLSGFVLAFVSAGETREHVVVTDEEGRADAALDAPGAWLVHGTELRRSGTAEREWDSEFTTMVVEVR